MKVSDNGGGGFEPCPAGNHVARCVAVIDMGTETMRFSDSTRNARKVLIRWEIPSIMRVFDESKGPQPVNVSKKYTASLNEKATLRKDLVSWRGKEFTADELKEFDLEKILGKACLLNVVHDTRNGQTYANVAGITPLPQGLTAPPLIGPRIHFDLDNFDAGVFSQLSEGVRAKIASSPEYQALREGVAHDPSGDEDMPF